jgi:hypothetical protein
MSNIPQTTPQGVLDRVTNARSTPGDGPGGISKSEYEHIQAGYNYMVGGLLGRYSASTSLQISGHHQLAAALEGKMDYKGYCALMAETGEQ